MYLRTIRFCNVLFNQPILFTINRHAIEEKTIPGDKK